MSENDKDSIYNLLTNTSRSGNNFPSAIYLVGTTKTNDSPTDFTTAACFRNYNSVLARDEHPYADTEIVHPDQTSPSIPSMGGIWCTMMIPVELLPLTTSFGLILSKNLEIFLTTFRL